MKNPNKEVRALIFGLINGHLSAPVYNAVLKSTAPPFVFIGSQDLGDNSAKDTFLTDTTINIDVVTKFTEDMGGDKQANDITDAIIQHLENLSGQSTSNFHIITNKVETSGMLYQSDGANRIVRQITTIRNLVQQK